jgi:predicted nucleic acid-binding protein
VTLVIDASVACKWFVSEPQSDQAEELLAGDEPLIAPDLIVPEVCNVAWLKLRRCEITFDQASAMVDGLPELLDEVVSPGQLAARALAIANALAHPAYDCFYLALAELRDTRLVTADRRPPTADRRPQAVGQLAGTHWARLVVSLGGGVVPPG